jgi:hypothetical protein
MGLFGKAKVMNQLATTQAPPLFAYVLPANDLRSVLLRIRNESEAEGELVFPNPYTGVDLLTLEHKAIPRCSFLAWEHNDPRLVLRPGDQVCALLNLAPFWMDIAADVLVRCKIVWKRPAHDAQTWFVEGPARLEFDSSVDLAKRIRSRQNSASTTIPASGKVLNVSDYICIEQTSTSSVPIRDEPRKLWA